MNAIISEFTVYDTNVCCNWSFYSIFFLLNVSLVYVVLIRHCCETLQCSCQSDTWYKIKEKGLQHSLSTPILMEYPYATASMS